MLVTILWLIAALCWLPWFALVIALVVSIIGGTPWDQSNYLQPALMGIWPRIGLDPMAPLTWLRWQIISVYPVCAFIGVALSAAGWRIYWREQDGILTRPARLVALSIIVPPVAPVLMWLDARQRWVDREVKLELDVVDARERRAAD